MAGENVDFFFSRQQDSRISQNFRASKVFLDRKRPRDSENFLDGVRCKTPAQVTASRRIPLMEISVNTPSPCSDTRNRSIQCGNRCSSAVSSSVDRTELKRGNAYEKTVFVSTSNKHVHDAFITPIRQPESVSLSDCFSTPSLLDDDFDESMLDEIDAICERESATKAEKQDLNVSSDVGRSSLDDIISGDFIASSNMLSLTNNRRVGSELGNGVVLDPKEFGISISSSIKDGSMPDEYSKYLESLNDKQREAACSEISIPLMIAAGPGSGKTSTMVGRVLMLLNEGISPSNILAMTFTTAAASEMRERIGKVAGKKIAKELTISTFHSFSLQLCRAHAEKLERTVDFLIYGHSQQRRAIIEAARLSENEKNCAAQDADGNFSGGRKPEEFRDMSKKWLKFVAQAKASGKTPAECRKTGNAIGAAILGNYNDILKSCNALDYHDLISCSLKLLTDFPEVFKECQDSWKAIIVDEFQDTSAMQYGLLKILASHNHITIVGDDDQSIFSFNGADVSGFDSFRKDFPNHKEIRLVRNYRSTRYIVEAASCLIQNNMNRCQSKTSLSENANGSKIVVKECYNEDAQCAYVVDKILETITDATSASSSYGNVAVLYRRQISGKLLQSNFRQRNIPFNTHGVAFYRKKVVKAIVAMIRTALPASDDDSYRKVFKAFLPCEKEEKKRILDYVDKIAIVRKCSFISAATDIFKAKISGTFKRSQLTMGRKVLSTLDMISKLAQREKSISAVITSVANMVPQKYLLEKRAVIDVDGGKYLNEDSDLRSVLQFLLDDVSDFLKQFTDEDVKKDVEEEKGCVSLLKCFVDYIAEREKENFRSRRHDNENSVTLTTIHQSKGLEWDVVFIVKANETEIPLLHEFNGASVENGTSVEEERRLLYVAMTRARKKLFILYVTVDSNWQLLQPSRFLREIPSHLLEIQAELSMKDTKNTNQEIHKENAQRPVDLPIQKPPSVADTEQNDLPENQIIAAPKDSTEPIEPVNGNGFLRRFEVEERSIISHLFHQWAKKPAFHQPARLLDKVRFVIDERLRNKNYKHKDVLRSLKSCLGCEEALQYAEYIVRWEQIPADQRAHLMREKQEHFQKLRMETAMGTSEATPKQIAYLKTLGCVESPTSRLHASRLIEQYKSL